MATKRKKTYPKMDTKAHERGETKHKETMEHIFGHIDIPMKKSKDTKKHEKKETRKKEKIEGTKKN